MAIRGRLEAVEQLQIRGWAFDPETPDEAMIVEICLDEACVATVPANLYRADLELNGEGDGRHAFIANMEAPLSQSDLPRITARVVGPGIRSLTLQKGPLAIRTAEAAPLRDVWVPHGCVEWIHPAHIQGWVIDHISPFSQLQVSARVADQEIGSAAVNRRREDLAEANLGHGHHGFTIELHQPIDPLSMLGELQVLVRDDKGNSATLPRLPQIVPTIFSRSCVDPLQRPVFILGAARSGTSTIVSALRAATRYKGYDEGHVFPLLRSLLLTTNT
jgi:hypothetical protein